MDLIRNQDQKLQGPRPKLWQKEELFFDGDRFFENLLADLKSAQKSIRFETYIFDNDLLGRRVVTALIQAAQRGVNVRLIVDGIGSPFFGRDFLNPLDEGGVQVRIFHPLPWQVERGQFEFAEFYQRLNRRNHRKVCIIDDYIAWVGSQNVSQRHLPSVVGNKAWRDTGVRLEGQAVGDLCLSFDSVWKYERLPITSPAYEKRRVSSALIRLNNTWLRRQYLYRDLIQRIIRAKSRIWITNAYFVPDGSLLRSLHAAAKRGVDIRILVPAESDVIIMRYVVSAFYYGLLKAGVRIFEYMPRFLHAKSLIIDQWAVVGSTNLNHRSLLHDLEVDAVLTSIDAKNKLAEQFLCDTKDAQEMTLNDWRNRPWLQKIFGNILLLFRYWM